MPYFFLPPEDIKFPPAHFADVDGLLAQGGDLTADWMIAGYKAGAYLWSSPMEPLKWWSPDPRVVIFPDKIKWTDDIEYMDKSPAIISIIDGDLPHCFDLCEQVQNVKEMNPTWITGLFKNVYKELNERGHVHCSLIREEKELIGCAFGTVIGRVFFCEYVTGIKTFASELALLKLAGFLQTLGVKMMDIDKETNAAIDLGFSEISRNEYLDLVKKWTND